MEEYCYIIQQIKVKGNVFLGLHSEVFLKLEDAQKYINDLSKEHNLTVHTDNYLDEGCSNIDNFVIVDGNSINIQILQKKLIR